MQDCGCDTLGIDSILSLFRSNDIIVLNGRRYEVLNKLADGGFASVYLVLDSVSKRQYAMKRISCQDQAARALAMAELDVFRKFDHPNICKLWDSGLAPSKMRSGQDDVVLILEYYSRGTLQDMIERMATEKEYMTETTILRIFLGICEGVACFHEAEPALAHRDIKPHNVLLGENNRPVLMDFGSAQVARRSVATREDELAMYEEAEKFTTPAYRAPELYDKGLDQDVLHVDESIDVWALGCVLYAMAYLENPFDSTVLRGGNLKLAVLSGQITFPPQPKYSKGLRELLSAMLSLRPRDRPSIQQVIHVAADLQLQAQPPGGSPSTIARSSYLRRRSGDRVIPTPFTFGRPVPCERAERVCNVWHLLFIPKRGRVATMETPRTNLLVTDDRVYEYLATERAVRDWVAEVLDVRLKEDLSELKSGVVLLYLMRKIDEDSVPLIHEDKHSYKQKENVQFFLGAVQDYGVPKHRVFQLYDLLDLKNKVNVIECIASLATIAAAKGFKPPLKLSTGDKASRLTLEPAVMRQLKELLSKVKAAPTQGGYRKEAPGIFQRKLAFLMGGNPVEFERFVKRWTKLQAITRGHLARLRFQKLKRQQAFRSKVAQELFDTENSYTKGLKSCIDVYLTRLRDVKKPVIDKAQLKTLFSDIEIIYALNSKLRDEIEQRVSKWSASQRLGDIFMKIGGFLKVYTGYVQNFDNALKLYEQLRSKNKAFVTLTDEARQQAAGNLDLTGFLIMPVQRVPRYSLLLQQLSKNTWSDHPDYADLETALKKIDEIAIYLNERKRQFENMQTIIKIQEGLSGTHVDLVAPTRSFLGRFDVDEVKKGERAFFLFNDLILFGKPEKKKRTDDKEIVEHKGHWRLDEVAVREIQGSKEGAFELVQVSNQSVLIKFVGKPDISVPRKLIQTIAAALTQTAEAQAARANVEKLAATSVEEDNELTVEEKLKLREEKKQKLKAQLEAEKAAIESNDTRSTDVSDVNLTAARRPLQRSMQSLIHLKVLVETQVEDIEHAPKKKKRDSGLETTAENLKSELAELDKQLQEATASMSPEEIEALQEKERELKAAQKEVELKAKNKKNRKSFREMLFGSKKDNSPQRIRSGSQPASRDASPSHNSTPPSPTNSVSGSPALSEVKAKDIEHRRSSTPPRPLNVSGSDSPSRNSLSPADVKSSKK